MRSVDVRMIQFCCSFDFNFILIFRNKKLLKCTDFNLYPENFCSNALIAQIFGEFLIVSGDRTDRGMQQDIGLQSFACNTFISKNKHVHQPIFAKSSQATQTRTPATGNADLHRHIHAHIHTHTHTHTHIHICIYVGKHIEWH